MNELTVERGFFTHRDQVLDDIRASGYWPFTYLSPPRPRVDRHWHHLDVAGYVMEGNTWFEDAQGRRIDLAPGDKFLIPAATLHAEGEVIDPVLYIIAFPEPGRLDELLQLHPAAELPRGVG